MEDLIKEAIFKLLEQGIQSSHIRIVCSPLARRALDDERMRIAPYPCDFTRYRGINIWDIHPRNEFLVFYDKACYQKNPDDYIITVPVNIEYHDKPVR